MVIAEGDARETDGRWIGKSPIDHTPYHSSKKTQIWSLDRKNIVEILAIAFCWPYEGHIGMKVTF